MRERLSFCFHLLLAGLIAILVDAAGGLSAVGVASPDALGQEPPQSVSLVVDYGDGVQKRFTQLKWQKGATVLDAMQRAKAHPRGITFKYRGEGATAFLTEIEDLKNEGNSGRNWIFRVNGDLGKQSFARVAVKPGDTILWKFERYR